MRDYSKISPAVWQSERFNNLPSDDGRYLYLYLLTNSHQTSAGCYRISDGYACTDLRWSGERYVRARNELLEADLIKFDAEHSVVMITRWFKHNPPMSEKHLIGIERQLERLTSQQIWKAASQALQESWTAISERRAAETARKQNGPVAALVPQQTSSTHLLNTRLMTKR